MTKISGPIFFYRQLFPAVLAMGALAMLLWASGGHRHALAWLAFGAAVLGVLYAVWRRGQQLITAVYDEGEHLLFCGKAGRQSVTLADVLRIDTSRTQFDERLFVTSRTAGCFGAELAFNLPVRAELSGEHPIATDLKARMIAARAPLAGAWVGSMS